MDKDALFLRMVQDFADQEVAPLDMDIDKNRKIPDSLYEKMVKAEFLGMNLPFEYGGANLSLVTIAKTLEIIATANASLAVILEGHMKTVYQLLRYGNERLLQHYFPAALKSIFAFSMTESTGGTNPSYINSTARKVDGGYIINGSKIMITNGGLADVYVVMAKDEDETLSFYVVDEKMAGFSYTEAEEFIGLTGTPVGGIAMENIFVPDYHRLNPINYPSLTIGDSAHADARVMMGAVLAGIQQHALNEVLDYAKERKAGAQKLWELQTIQRKIADISIGYQTTRLLYQDAALKRDLDNPEYFLLSTMAKAYGSRTAVTVGDDAMQAMGAYGFSAEFPIAHLIRDARALEFAEGSVEKMRTEITKFEAQR
ncbi:butyryl-CoA dehydrogenase [Weissella oryzae SG25]|uniref:Butyryl-CoA dehydrogenase n=1 Tax=Weissella oryzae (strain DSM 25784 / JCM 18191 / LMG 30913 / SG25) TaxID=1329250 RepID=A0A069CSR1_WEIOS|nr:acyl-CoA dehydrogenase family protein [Weissella oryzae]GAK30835.1 butyryl-CoA dehydrogenase [Weissella oryzae SG25]